MIETEKCAMSFLFDGGFGIHVNEGAASQAEQMAFFISFLLVFEDSWDCKIPSSFER